MKPKLGSREYIFLFALANMAVLGLWAYATDNTLEALALAGFCLFNVAGFQQMLSQRQLNALRELLRDHVEGCEDR